MATVSRFLRHFKTGSSILIIYRHGTRMKYFPTGVSKIDPEIWNDKKNKIDRARLIKPTKDNQQLLETAQDLDSIDNLKINEIEGKILSIARRLEYERIEPTCDKIYQEYSGEIKPDKPKYLIDEFKRYVEHLDPIANEYSPHTIKHFKTTSNRLEEFLTGDRKYQKTRWKLEDITPELITDFKKFLIKAGKAEGTVSINLTKLKKFLRDQGINTVFDKIKITKPKIDPNNIIYLTDTELKKLARHKLPKFSRLDKARDILLLACSTGLRFSDVTRLRKERIKKNIIQITTEKTDETLRIPLGLYAPRILKKYDYQVPKISNQKLNEYIKEVCHVAKIEDKVMIDKWKGQNTKETVFEKWQLISSHTGKKTFVMLNVKAGTPIHVLANMTGNTLETLKHYYTITDEIKRQAIDQVELKLKIK